MNRAYSVLNVKAVDADTRTITGWATTPGVDRVGDIVEPLGVQYKNPLPLLWQHDHQQPVGLVEFGKPTAEGVPFTAKFADVTEPVGLFNRIEEAWQSVKAGLVRAVSIGFRNLGSEPIKGSWGTRYLKTEVYELSLVTIPANAAATITSIKSFDVGAPAATGKKGIPVVRVKPAGASATVVKHIPKIPKPEEGQEMKTTAEQIAEFEATRVAKSLEMEQIMTASGEAGATLDAEQSEAFDNLEAELGAIDKHLTRLKGMQAFQAKNAKAVTEQGNQNVIKTVDTSGIQVRAANTQKLEPGIAFARAAKCLALGHLEHRDAIGIAKALYDGQEGVIAATQQLVTKAAVAPATTTGATWAAPLVGEDSRVFADFVEYLRPQTILGRFGQAPVPGLRRVPFRTALIGQTSGGDGYWVGEGQAKPLTAMDFERKSMEPLKVANIAVATMELIRDSNPSADALIRDTLAAALRERLDRDFINPAKAAVAGISPASILNGVAGIPSSGATADNVRIDVKALFTAFIQANNAPTSGVWLMSSVSALALSLMQNPLGQTEFPGIGMLGGTFFGLPVIVSEYVPTDSSGSLVALVNAGDIYEADEGGIDLSMSTEASLQMESAPDNPSTASTVMVSLWQRNLVGFRAERTINWQRRRESAVAWLSGVNWGS